MPGPKPARGDFLASSAARLPGQVFRRTVQERRYHEYVRFGATGAPGPIAADRGGCREPAQHGGCVCRRDSGTSESCAVRRSPLVQTRQGWFENRMPCVTRTSIFRIRPLVRAEFGQRYTEYRVNPMPTVRGGADKESPASGGASMSASRGKDQVFIAVRRRFNACFSTWRIRSAETPYRSASSCRVSLLSPSHRALRTSRARASSVSRAE